MKPRNGAIAALLFLATCNMAEQDRNSPNIESSPQALGQIPASEVAIWQRVGGNTLPVGRYLQAVTFDETRGVAVMFGGLTYNYSSGMSSPNQEIWEWSPATGDWTNRTPTAGTQPDARSGSAMVFDSKRNKIVLFGGRAGSGFNYADTWEWDPASGQWTDATSSGSRPSARSQHAMVYEKSTGKILLFGGGRSDSTSYDGTGISVSFGDTWEWDPTTRAWTQLKSTASPAARHDFGMVWDSSRNMGVLFGGMEKDAAGVDGSPMQDIWEWDPSAGTWNERTTQGSKPSARYAHSMAFAGGSNKAIVFGGWDITTGGSLNDLWEWDPVSGAWTLRLDGTKAGIPSARMYASLVSDNSKARLELIAGMAEYYPYSGAGGSTGMPSPPYATQGSREVWEIDETSYACQDRSAPSNAPLPRSNHALAYNPSTGKTYVFGGMDINQQPFDDLWEWDGKTWTRVVADVRPPARSDAGLAYDPVRKSLILYGGQSNQMITGPYYGTALGDTWEWSSTTRQWKQLFPAASPDPLYSHGMVTDTTRNRILLFAGMSDYKYVVPPGGVPGYKDPIRNEVWEWDGSSMTWTNRTPIVSSAAPSPRQYPILAYDEARQKLFVEESSQYSQYGSGSPSAFWEWDPISAGWTMYDTGDYLDYGMPYSAVYDSTRRREVVYGELWSMSTGIHETWELDAKGPTWYVREIKNSPSAGYGLTMAFDRARGVVVLFGGNANGYPTDETWEYSVANLANGEGCSTSTASACASGNCVDGVCCASASCTGPCKSCSVSGQEGTCVLAQAGTQVPGSCASGQACDGSGNCKASNGQACSSASTCASGFCVDGVCCDSACNGTCVTCSQAVAGFAGTCRPYAAGSDPEKECGPGSGVCKAGCDGVGACALPPYGTTCGTCMLCDGKGTCSQPDYNCGYGTGGASGYGGRGGTYGTGGTTGYGTGGTLGRGGIISTGGYGLGGTYGIAGTTGYGYGGSLGRGGTISTGGYGFGGTYGVAGTTGYGGALARGGTTSTGGYGFGGNPIQGGNPIRGGTIGTGGTPGYGGAFSNPAGGSGGGSGGASGHGGSSGNRDGGYPGAGGRANPDAQGQDAIVMAQLHRSGCNCTLESAAPAGPGLATPIFLAGFAFLVRRIRRPRR